MEESLYERVGGREFFVDLIDRFYGAVRDDPLLRPMYPEELDPARDRLTLFVIQYFGGPRDYEKLRGDPRLRLRHLKFNIDRSARDAWMSHMVEAIKQSTTDETVATELLGYFAATASFLINRGLSMGPGPHGAPGDPS